MCQGSASVASWSWEKYSCHSKLFQPCQCCCCMCYPREYLRLGTLISYSWAQVLEACDCLKLLSIYFDLCVMPPELFVISLVFSALISMPDAVEALSRRSTKFASSPPSPAKLSMSSAKQRFVVVLLPMLIVPLWFSKTSVIILSRNMLKRVGESRQQCRNPAVVVLAMFTPDWKRFLTKM